MEERIEIVMMPDEDAAKQYQRYLAGVAGSWMAIHLKQSRDLLKTLCLGWAGRSLVRDRDIFGKMVKLQTGDAGTAGVLNEQYIIVVINTVSITWPWWCMPVNH